MNKIKKPSKFEEQNKDQAKKKSHQLIEKLRLENEDLKATIENYKNLDMMKDITFLKTTVNDKELEIQILEEKRENDKKDNEQELNKLKEIFVSVQKNLQDKLDDIEKQNETLRFKAKSIEELEMINVNLLQQITKLENDLIDMDEKWNNKLIETQKQSVRDRLKIKCELTDKLDKIAEKYQNDVNDRISKQMTNILEENVNLKLQIVDIEEDFRTSQKNLSLYKEKVQTQSLEIVELKNINSELINTKKRISEDLVASKCKINVQFDYDELKKYNEKLSNNLMAKNQEIEKLQFQFDKEVEEKRNINDKLKSLEKFVDGQKTLHKTIKNEIKKISALLHETTTSSKERNSEFIPSELYESRLKLYEEIAKIINNIQ